MRKFIPIFLVSLTLVYIETRSQIPQLTPKIIPPSPTASELGKYGLVPIGLSTGTINSEIPLYTFKTKNLTLPISLSYNSNGVKVDEVSSWVGLHWSLNCGGVISRIVRDKPDDGVGTPYPSIFNLNDPMAVSYIEQAGTGSMDTEPDLYTFNFMGYVGKFVYDRNGEVTCMPRNDLNIGKITGQGPGGFIITSPDGIKYTFEAPETSVSISSNDTQGIDAVTSWYLTKVEHPLGDVIHLRYEASFYTYYSGFSQALAKVMQQGVCGYPNENQCDGGPLSSVTTYLNVAGQRLTKIEAVGYGSIDFHSSKDRSDLNDYKLNDFSIKNAEGKPIKGVSMSYVFSNNAQFSPPIGNGVEEDLKHRMFLKTVSEKDANGGDIRKHEFDYEDIDGLPTRLSFAQDHWGYFNGASNSSFLPKTLLEEKDIKGKFLFEDVGGNRENNADFSGKGMLKKITYPTGGTSTFIYGPNTYYGPKLIYPNLTNASLQCNGINGPPSVSMSITSPIAQKLNISVNSTTLENHLPTPASATFSVTNSAGDYIIGGSLALNSPVSAAIPIAANDTYIFTLTAVTGDYIENTTVSYLSVKYYTEAPHTVYENLETGGMRVNEVVNYDPATGKTEAVKYHYSSHNQLTKSSGEVVAAPEYITRYSVKSRCVNGHGCESLTCSFAALHSSNTSSLFNSSNNIYYRYVTIDKGGAAEGGLEEHEFSLRFDVQGTQVWGTDHIKDAPLSNIGWDNGKETDIRYFVKKQETFALIKHVHNHYVNDTRYHKEVPALVVRKKFEPFCKQDAVNYCDTSNINLVYRIFTCTANHKHQLMSARPGEDHDTCISFGAKNEWDTIAWHPCYRKQIGETVATPYYMDYLDAYEYRNISDWVYLDKTTEVIYTGLDSIVKETEYIYGNSSHMQLSRIRTSTSDSKNIDVDIKYPLDYSITETTPLTNKYIINLPVKKETTVGGNQVKGEVVIYNEKGQPSNIYHYESQALKPPLPHSPVQLVPSTDYKLKSSITFDPITNNISKVQPMNNVSTVYLWGYQNTLPIAEVINADIASTLVDYNASHTVSETVLYPAVETALWPCFEIFTTQAVNSVLQVSTTSSSPSSSPKLTLILKKSDGTSIRSHTATWGSNNINGMTLSPGVYQWYYYTDYIAFNVDFNISTNYIGKKPIYRLLHTSFEEDGVINPSAKTGDKVWSNTYNVSIPAENGNYMLSYWRKYNGTEWELVKQPISATAASTQTITIGGNGALLDEVRLHPVSAMMTTYTHDPLIGITSITDTNNKITYYKYDNFGRLSSIVDDKGNLLKHYVYHYSEQN